MKQWNGLLKKEWLLMKEWLYGTGIIAALLMLIAPLGLSKLVEGSINTFLILGITFVIWIVISLFLPVSLLLNSLWKEWKSPDLWLHSTSSIFKLFGVKSTFSAIFGAVNLLVSILLFSIYASIFDSPLYELSFNKLITFVSILALSFYAASIMIMCVGLFLLVFSRFIRPFSRGFTIPNTVILFLLATWLFERLKEFSVYQKISKFGPIGNPMKEEFLIERENFYIGPVEPVIYTGDVLMSLLFISFLFISASILFEKKVRL